MIIYIDITEFVISRINTGIQRVLKEFLQRVILDKHEINIIYFDEHTDNYQLLDNTEVKAFLQEVKTYDFTIFKSIDLYTHSEKDKIFLELDSVWNCFVKRIDLYPKLKQYNFKIVNLIYDLTPILFKKYAKENTKINFPLFLNAVYKYSDFVFFDSLSAEQDFNKLQIKTQSKIKAIPTKVIYLGSDFSSTHSRTNTKYEHLISKKYILFVGTIEPRKNQLLALKAFEEVYKKHTDLHLVFIGKMGWKTQSFNEYLDAHPLKDTNVHHLRDIDDDLLSLFYKSAFLVTYLSKYEGYGLPIAESLQYGNITITSKNSSMYEVGKGFADYLLKNEKNELIHILSLYLDNQNIYDKKKKFIKEKYIPPSWDKFYISFIKELSLI